MENFNCWNIKKQAIEFSVNNSEDIRILSQKEKENIRIRFTEKYVRKGVKIGYSIFEALEYEYIGIDIPDSWKWIKDFIKNHPIIIFFNHSEESEYFEFKNGAAFVKFYESLPLVEFYICDFKLSYLLAYNHSQCLIAMGNATGWLENDKRYINRYKK